MVSWDEAPPKLDIRYWSPDPNNPQPSNKGATLDDNEAKIVYEALDEWLKKAGYSWNKYVSQTIRKLNRRGWVNRGNCVVYEKIATLIDYGNGAHKELNLVQWYGWPPKLDIRYWASNNSHDTKGITLDENEAVALYSVLRKLLASENKNSDKAKVDALKREAQAGNVSAMQLLGDMYRDGNSVPQSYEEAFKWYKEHALAKEDVAELLSLAASVIEWHKNGRLNYKISAKMIAEIGERATAAGDARGMFLLGNCYWGGLGVDVDQDEAFSLFEQAMQISEFSVESVATKNGLKHIFEAYHRAACHGNGLAIARLGDMFYFGWGTEADHEAAIRWYTAAAKERSDFCSKVGDMYRYGLGVTQYYNEAIEWYKRGVDAGDARSMYALADMYYLGLGVEKNYIKYIDLRKKAEACKQ